MKMQKLERKMENVILEILGKPEQRKIRFTQLLKECRKKQPSLSKVTLTKYLKILLQTKEIEKRFDSEHFKGYYQIANRGLAKLMVDSWMNRLGKVAVDYIIRKKLNKPIDVNSDIFDEIEQYLKLEPEKDSLWSWKALFEYFEKDYLRKKYPLI